MENNAGFQVSVRNNCYQYSFISFLRLTNESKIPIFPEETALEAEEGAVGGKIGPQRSDADAAAARLQSTTSVLNDEEGAVGGVIPDQVAASVDKSPVIASGQNDLESANSNAAKTSKETDGTST